MCCLWYFYCKSVTEYGVVKETAVVSAHHQGLLNFLFWGTELVSSGAVFGWCGCAVFEIWCGGGVGCYTVMCSSISLGWHLLEHGHTPLYSVPVDRISPFATWSTWCLPLLVSLFKCWWKKKCKIHICYLWGSKVFSGTFWLGFFLLGICFRLPIAELLLRNKYLYFSAWHAEVRERRLH